MLTFDVYSATDTRPYSKCLKLITRLHSTYVDFCALCEIVSCAHHIVDDGMRDVSGFSIDVQCCCGCQRCCLIQFPDVRCVDHRDQRNAEIDPQTVDVYETEER
jgi:hypothetical protein